jgi:flagellar biosynthesis chaperone FliJ
MMGRIKRAERLLEVADRAVKSALAAAAAAERSVVAARAVAERQERAWEDAAQAFGWGAASSTDLRDQAAHLRTLRVHADATADRLALLIDDQRKACASLVEASRRHRILELWRDRIRETEQTEQRARERRGSDELAARVTRARQ